MKKGEQITLFFMLFSFSKHIFVKKYWYEISIVEFYLVSHQKGDQWNPSMGPRAENRLGGIYPWVPPFVETPLSGCTTPAVVNHRRSHHAKGGGAAPLCSAEASVCAKSILATLRLNRVSLHTAEWAELRHKNSLENLVDFQNESPQVGCDHQYTVIKFICEGRANSSRNKCSELGFQISHTDCCAVKHKLWSKKSTFQIFFFFFERETTSLCSKPDRQSRSSQPPALLIFSDSPPTHMIQLNESQSAHHQSLHKLFKDQFIWALCVSRKMSKTCGVGIQRTWTEHLSRLISATGPKSKFWDCVMVRGYVTALGKRFNMSVMTVKTPWSELRLNSVTLAAFNTLIFQEFLCNFRHITKAWLRKKLVQVLDWSVIRECVCFFFCLFPAFFWFEFVHKLYIGLGSTKLMNQKSYCRHIGGMVWCWDGSCSGFLFSQIPSTRWQQSTCDVSSVVQFESLPSWPRSLGVGVCTSPPMPAGGAVRPGR